MWRSISTLSLATMAGQGVAIVAIPVITRIYGPTIYGNYQTLYAAIMLLGTVASLRLERAIPLVEKEYQARAAVAGAYIFTVATTGAIGIYVLIAPQSFARILGNDQVASSAWIVPVGALLTSSYVIATQWAVRVRNHNPIALRNALQPAVMTSIQLIAGSISASLGSLSIGLLVGRLVGAVSAAKQLATSSVRPRWRSITTVMKRYRGFMLLSAPSGLLNTAALQLPILMLGAYYGAESAGLYGVSAMLTVAPVTLLAGASSQVLLGIAAARLRDRRGGVLNAIRRIGGFAAMIGVAAALGVALLAQFASTILGEDWGSTTPYLVALSIVLAARLPASTISPVLSAFERHKTQLAIDAARVVWVIASVLVAQHEGWPVETTLYVMAVGVASTYVVAIIFTMEVARRYERAIRRPDGGVA